MYKNRPAEMYLSEIADYLSDPDYRIRCSALNHLISIVTEQNKEFLEKCILKLKQAEKSEAVLSTIKRLEAEMQGAV